METLTSSFRFGLILEGGKMSERYLYAYHGPVMSFGRCICSVWCGETVASTEAEAKRNLTYQAKKSLGFTAQAAISLTNSPKIVKKNWR